MKLKLISFFSIVVLCVLGISASAQNVYLRIELQPDTWHYYDSSYDQVDVHDFYVRAYSDASCTTPVALSSNITVTLQCNSTYQSSYGSYSNISQVYLPINASESEYYYDDRPLSLYSADPYSLYTFSYTILPGTGYTVVPGYTYVN